MHSISPVVFSLLFAGLIHYGCSHYTEPGTRATRSIGTTTQYRAAVLEMIPFFNPQISPIENEMENVRIMTGYALLAKEAGADIMVFPEQIFTTDAPTDRKRFRLYAHVIRNPDESYVMCYDGYKRDDNNPIVEMSCAAKNLGMYLVFNIPEKEFCSKYRDLNCTDRTYIYNTNIVFDRKGAMISKYRKQNLFEEPQFDIGNNTKYNTVFTTDFGVTFGQHVGFDVMYYHPSVNNFENHGIRDFVMPSNWVDTLPFYTAPQVQYSWSRGLGVNLLAAGIHKPGVGSSGSGIYTGATDILKSTYIYNDTRASRVLINDVTTNLIEGNFTTTSSKKADLSTVDTGNPDQISLNNTWDNHGFVAVNAPDDLFYDDLLTGISQGTVESTVKNLPDDRIPVYYTYDIYGVATYLPFHQPGLFGMGKCNQYSQILSMIYCPQNDFPCATVECPNPADPHGSCGEKPFKRVNKASFNSMNFTAIFDAPHLYPSVIDQNFQLVSEEKWTFTTQKEGNRTIASIIFLEPIEFLYAATIIGRWYDKDPDCRN